ncbi:hypothetical protein [Candidatus Villigracilis affinis]|uniref:hypothetical protein n=1 Tax=Candidatus Villigracilis affinis TaxID=3140682 RepID=UPI001DCD6E58|nr:hypothetical protein [Anaerolineales bacterium]
MTDLIFLKYFWTGPILWALACLVNYFLGKYIANLNRTIFLSTGIESEDTNKNNFLWTLLRIFLITPTIVFFWWTTIYLFKLSQVYLFVFGFSLLQWINAIIRQLSSLLAYHLPRLLNHNNLPDSDTIKYSLEYKYIAAAADHLGYFLIYLLATVLTKNWFLAGGAFVSLVNIIRHLVRHLRKSNRVSGTNQ